jgi:P-type Ca2+ transporter type 2C
MTSRSEPPSRTDTGSSDLDSSGHAVDGPGVELPHALSVEVVLARLTVDGDTGLSHDEVSTRRHRFGFNRLQEAGGTSTWSILIDQLRSAVVLLLVIAAVAGFAIGKNVEGVAVLVVLVANTVIGFVTELRALRSMEALDALATALADVERQDRRDEIDAVELVPGDIVSLEAGDGVPADLRLIEAEDLRIEEASLTGESEPVLKTTEPLPTNTSMGDRTNMAFMGTTVLAGRGRGVVVATGRHAAVGRIAELTAGTPRMQAPLQAGLEQLGRTLTLVVIGLAIALTGLGLARGSDLDEVLEISIALAVAIVPEGLPAVATLTLTVGMRRMARQNALVRRLPVVETLGSTTVIASDKTGTLTRNEMTVAAFTPAEGIDVSDLWLAAVVCNDSDIAPDGDPVGDPTEVALLHGATDAGLDWRALRDDHARVGEVPFDSATKRMAVATADVIYLKGAPEVIIQHGTPGGASLLVAVEEMSAKALRTLALARKRNGGDIDAETAFADIELLGIVGLADPARPDAIAAVEECRQAGIRVVMVTGDQPRTAAAIGEQFGMRTTSVVTGVQLDDMSPEQLVDTVRHTDVFARVNPEHKLRIVEALQANGEIVAVTGDGVNDAPALSQANVGVAMGGSGTEVARQAADIVLTDDDFTTITHAVAEGRRIFANVQRFGRFIFSWHLGVTIIVTVAVLTGSPPPLAGLMILWNNLVIDVLPSFALALEPAGEDTMKDPPRPAGEPVLGRSTLKRIATQAALIAAVGLGTFYVLAPAFDLDGASRQTMTFVAITAAQLLAVFNARTETGSGFVHATRNPFLWLALAVSVAFEAAALGIPALRDTLGLSTMPAGAWSAALLIAVGPLLLTQTTRIVRQRWSTARTHRG